MKKLLILATAFIFLSLPAFAEWELEYEQRKNIVYITTINTNQGEAWLTITVNPDDTFVIFMQFQDMHFASENIKIEYKLDANDSKFITGKRDRDKLALFTSSRNHENTISFIENLKSSQMVTIKFNDGYKKTRTFIFDVTNLQNAFEQADKATSKNFDSKE